MSGYEIIDHLVKLGEEQHIVTPEPTVEIPDAQIKEHLQTSPLSKRNSPINGAARLLQQKTDKADLRDGLH